MQDIKLWKVDKGLVSQVYKAELDFERELEKWLMDDISIISDDLLVIGNQVYTDYGDRIDILAMNAYGELVVIELKRGEAHRKVIAQALDYASWAKILTYDDLNEIFRKHNPDEEESLKEYFASYFNQDIEDVEDMNFNTSQKMLIVGTSIDDATIRIIDYLSNAPFNVLINAITFNYFKDRDGNEFIAQSFANPEIEIIEEARSKKTKTTAIKELFANNKLIVGQKLYFKPAIEHGIKKEEVCAEIMNTDNRCLKMKNDDELYSFSGLRKKLGTKYKLDFKVSWGFGMKADWITEDGKSLVDLLYKE